MEIVQFDDGKFAIRKQRDLKIFGIILSRALYYDLRTRSSTYYWDETSPYFKDCITEDEDMINEVFDQLTGSKPRITREAKVIRTK